MQTSNGKIGVKTRKTKGGDESSKDQIMVNRPKNNVPQTDDSRLDNVGIKDILSEPEPTKARLKFKGKNDLASPEIEEREFDLNLSEDDESHHDSSRPPTEAKKQRTGKTKFEYEETQKEHEERSKYKFSVDNEDIEKSVRESEDELYKQPISFFPQTKKHSTIGSRDEDIGGRGRSPHQGSEKTIEEYNPSNAERASK